MSSPNPKTPTSPPPPPPPTTTTSGHRQHPHPLPLPNPTLPITTQNLRSTRRTSSSSSSSSSSSFSSSPISPTTPIRHHSSIAAVPFSWERIPGIPKSSISKLDSSIQVNFTPLLPLPPIPKKQSIGKNGKDDRFLRDPFVEALIRCSKDGDGAGLMGSRGRSRGRFAVMVGLNGYNCKRSCGVAESIVFVPRAKRIGYDVIEKRRV